MYNIAVYYLSTLSVLLGVLHILITNKVYRFIKSYIILINVYFYYESKI